MKTLQITTTQNVRIDYEIARLTDRFLAWLIDVIVIVVAIMIYVFTMASFDVREDWAFELVIYMILFLYTPAMEILNNGQTLGKMALRMKVMTIHGKNPEIIDFVIRWCFRMVDIYATAGGLAAILVSSGTYGQRLGGVLSNTTVVKLEPSKHFNLRELLRISTAENYEPQYPKVRQLSEQDMLTIKNALSRYKKYRNSAHKEVVLAAADRVEELLDISRGELNQYKFLQVLIKDYIVLTR